MKQDTFAGADVITWSGYSSLLESDRSVKPTADIGAYPHHAASVYDLAPKQKTGTTVAYRGRIVLLPPVASRYDELRSV